MRRVRRLFGERREAPHDFAALIVKPWRMVNIGGAMTALIDNQDGGVENAVAQRLQRERVTARRPAVRNDDAAAGDVVEIFEDDPAVIDGAVIVGDQHRYFAERVVLPQHVPRVHRIGAHEGDAFREAEMQDGHAHLAGERGEREARNSIGQAPGLS